MVPVLDPLLVVDRHAVHHRAALLARDQLKAVAELDGRKRACRRQNRSSVSGTLSATAC